MVRHGNQNGVRNGRESKNGGGAGAQGITQRQLAELVGTREIEISRIETGRVTPDAAMKQRIAVVLGKPTFELFDA